ncbi:MAG: tetratricopeptide repeat protein [Bacteroidetes bacterium]|nr:tetratricopeptide repeat protein [Bacteroidota bacterium]
MCLSLVAGCISISNAQVEPPKGAIYNMYRPGQKPQQTDETQLAAQYYRNQEYEKAAVLYEKLFNENPTYSNYTYYLYCLTQLNQMKEAEKLVKKQIRANPEKVRYLVDLGYVYMASGETVKANEQYEKAINSLPPDRNAIVELANAFQSKRETDYAIQTYIRGRELLENSYTFSLELGQIYDIAGRYEEMFNIYLDLLENDMSQIEAVENKLQLTLSDDPDDKKNELFRTILLRRVQKYPDQPFYAEMLLWFAIQQKDFETALTQVKALDRRYHEEGQRVFNLAQLSASNNNYDVAIEAYQYIITSKGASSTLYLKSRIELLGAEFLKLINSYNYSREYVLTLETDYTALLSELGRSTMTLPAIRNMAHLDAFYLDKSDQALQLLNEAILLPNLSRQQKAECKLELADILLFTGDPWEATLLYSQVEKDFKNDPMGHDAKFKNAKLCYYIGEFAWAKAQLDVLKAATSKLIANDAMELSLLISDNMDADSTFKALNLFARADLLTYMNKPDQALPVLDSINLNFPYHALADEVLYRKANIMINKGRFAQADSLLERLVNEYPADILADNAMYKMAQLNELNLNQPEKAMELYRRLLSEYPGSLFVTDARKRYRQLRGDEVN